MGHIDITVDYCQLLFYPRYTNSSSLAFRMTKETKLRIFQFKIIHNVLFSPIECYFTRFLNFFKFSLLFFLF